MYKVVHNTYILFCALIIGIIKYFQKKILFMRTIL